MTWYLAPALVQLCNQINAAYPQRDKTTDGSIGDAAHNARKSDHNADWDAGGIVRAIDVDRDLHPGDLPATLNATWALVDALTRDGRTACVIYRSRIWTPGKGWQPYTSAGKTGWFNPHEQHFHISLRHGKAYDHDTRPWSLPQGEDEMSAEDSARLERIEQALMVPGQPFGWLPAIANKVDAGNAVTEAIRAGYTFFPGQPYYAAHAIVNAIREEGPPEPVSPAELAAALAPLVTANLSALTDADVQRIAAAAADEHARRLA